MLAQKKGDQGVQRLQEESQRKHCREVCFPVMYLGDGAQDSGSPTCSREVPVLLWVVQCEY